MLKQLDQGYYIDAIVVRIKMQTQGLVVTTDSAYRVASIHYCVLLTFLQTAVRAYACAQFAAEKAGSPVSGEIPAGFPFKADAIANIANQAQFNPLKYVQGLAAAIAPGQRSEI
jgi:hypothetical protein